jgi:hypothetical protein
MKNTLQVVLCTTRFASFEANSSAATYPSPTQHLEMIALFFKMQKFKIALQTEFLLKFLLPHSLKHRQFPMLRSSLDPNPFG